MSSRKPVAAIVMLLTAALFSVGAYLVLTGLSDAQGAIETGFGSAWIAELAGVPFLAPVFISFGILFAALAVVRLFR